MKTLGSRLLSPYQITERKAPKIQHPIAEEVQKNTGKFDLTIEFEEDRQTLEMFKKISNLIAFVCRIKKGNEIIGFGHGASIINKANKFIEKTVCFARNAALIDAVVRSTKLFDVLNFGPNQQEDDLSIGRDYQASSINAEEKPSEKQISYFTHLVTTLVENDAEREQWLGGIPQMNRSDMAEAISEFAHR